MNNLPLQPLAWIEANHPNGVYFEKTNSYIKAAICFCSTLVTDYVIRHDNDTGMYVVNYGGRTEPEYDTLNEAKNWCEFTHYASKMQPYVKPDSITDIANWFKAAKPKPTDKDRCVQIGCHYEEVAEMMIACQGYSHYGSNVMNNCAEAYKETTEAFGLDEAHQPKYHIELLDSLCDQIVTATGVAYMMGFDIEGALKEVIRSNNSKMVDGKFEFDDNGKIMKPESYSKPDLTPFISTMQNLHKGE